MDKVKKRIVFILDNGVTEIATLDSVELLRMDLVGYGYAKWPGGQKAAAHTKDINKEWKFID